MCEPEYSYQSDVPYRIFCINFGRNIYFTVIQIYLLLFTLFHGVLLSNKYACRRKYFFVSSKRHCVYIKVEIVRKINVLLFILVCYSAMILDKNYKYIISKDIVICAITVNFVDMLQIC